MSKEQLNDKQRLFLKIYQKNMGVVAKVSDSRKKEIEELAIKFFSK